MHSDSLHGLVIPNLRCCSNFVIVLFQLIQYVETKIVINKLVQA